MKKRILCDSQISEHHKFTIAPEDQHIIIRYLRTEIYSDKILAFIREYFSNALDAHIEAGCSHLPIHIWLPSSENPLWVCQDSGNGLSEENIWNIFINFGKSTKRSNDNTVGELGVGCKAGFAYRDDFVITSWYNCVKTVYRARIDEDGDPELLKLYEENCSFDKHGLEVSIEIYHQDIETVVSKSLHYFTYLPVQPIIHTGEIVPVYDDVLSGSNWIIKKYPVKISPGIFMGSVLYPIDKTLLVNIGAPISGLFDIDGLCITVPLGFVDFDVSRERLQYTYRTQKNLQQVLENVYTEILQKIRERFCNIDDVFDAKNYLGILRNILPASVMKVIEKETLWNNHVLHGTMCSSNSDVSILIYNHRYGKLLSRSVIGFLPDRTGTTGYAIVDPGCPVRGRLVRLEELFQQYRYTSVYVFNPITSYDRVIETVFCGKLSQYVHKLSEVVVPKKDSIQRESQKTTSIFCLSTVKNTTTTGTYWEPAVVPENPGVYIPIYRYNPQCQDGYQYSVYDIYILQNMLHNLHIDTPIYGIRVRDCKKFSTWTQFEHYFQHILDTLCSDNKIYREACKYVAYKLCVKWYMFETTSDAAYKTEVIEKLSKDHGIAQLYHDYEKYSSQSNYVGDVILWDIGHNAHHREYTLYPIKIQKDAVNLRYPLLELLLTKYTRLTNTLCHELYTYIQLIDRYETNN